MPSLVPPSYGYARKFVFLFAAATALLLPCLTGFIVDAFISKQIRLLETRIQIVKTYSH